MDGAKVSIYIALAFVVGAIAPLLGLLAAAFVVGSVWASSRSLPHQRHCDPELYAQIEQWTEAERQKLRLK